MRVIAIKSGARRTIVWAGLTYLAWIVGLAVISACDRPRAGSLAAVPAAPAVSQTSASCRSCHPAEFAAWEGTDHALANRLADEPRDQAVLATFPKAAGAGWPAAPDMILGHKPLWQALVPVPGGRWQVHELAFDPVKQEWFNVFGAENRQPGEWGHWTGRGLNWNSMCAQCHMTGFNKNYDAVADAYASTWVEQGVGCIQCHGALPANHGVKGSPAAKSVSPLHGDRALMQQVCFSCHARSEQLSADFRPGSQFSDHFRLVLPVEAAVFFPDGQVRGEDFNATSVLQSRMGHAGVTCLDCHDPHSSKTILPVENNQLCLQCHATPGRVLPSGTRAVPINPTVHSHHAEGSAGNLCVSCHMPVTTYMQRSPRHDHGWLKPDPLLTEELGIPNACNRCHTEQPVSWAIEKSQAWSGAKLDSTQRARARAVASAQAGDPGASAGLLKLLAREDIPAWRATFLALLAPAVPDNPSALAAATASLAAVDSLEREAAVQAVGAAAAERLRPLTRDPVRSVRLAADWVLSPGLPSDSAERKELDAYLALTLDQPTGRLRLGQDLANRGQLAPAEAEMRRAVAWDPNAPGILDSLGLVLHRESKSAEAAATFSRAAHLAPGDADLPFRAALTYADARMWPEAEGAFRMAVERDPRFDRAWYNLGLLLVQTARAAEGAQALRKAEQVAPRVADYPYALATVLLRDGDRAGALSAVQRALAIDPLHRGALELRRQL